VDGSTALTPFFTPEPAIRLALPLLDDHPSAFDGIRILEPCAGEGRIVRELAAWYGHRPSIVAVEPREELRGACEAAGADVVVSCGAGEYVERQMRGPLKPFDLIITNPPFSLACDIWDA